MNLLSALGLRWRPSRCRAARYSLPRCAQTDGVLQEAEVEIAGCGWFDSTWALHVGLQITEHESADRVVNDLPLAWWLAWQPLPQLEAPPQAAR
jgi:hypothetical protein